ncbi:MAG: hypothetical protein HC936_16115 [Leptolyngbyaceae cyanobacterium SU_3_3]|nr:hypothetical protein [Leptolyngbyaceae cyanobacterium SU_3_3]
MSLIAVVQQVFDRPPLPFDANRQSLKAWAKYCLQDKGFKVVYAQNADFAIETSTGEKAYFKVGTQAEDFDSSLLDAKVGWIVVNESGSMRSSFHPRAKSPYAELC